MEDMVHRRRPINYRDSTTPQHEVSDEDEFILDYSQDLISSKSDSDLEKQTKPVHTYKELKKIEISRRVSRSPPQVLERKIVNTFTTPKSTQESKKTFINNYIFLAIIILIAIYFFKKSSETKNCSFEILQKQYPRENPFLWKRLKIGIELILNRRTEKPGVYLFAHFGSQQSSQLVKDLAAHSSCCFGQKLLPIHMENDDFIAGPGLGQDYGYAIKKYKNKIQEGNVILIANLNKLPAEAARALHFICDTHSPIVKNVVIFLELIVQPNKEGSDDAIVEEALIEQWGSKLARNELDPLITRITDEVIILKS